MIPRHVKHPRRDFLGFVSAMIIVFFLSGAIGIVLALIMSAQQHG